MIILLGFPKSGTKSFQKLFIDLGYNSYHWKKGADKIGMLIKRNKETNKPLLSDFKNSDCITQMDICSNKDNVYWPQITDYEQIYNENPDAIFILNKRNPIKLLLSFKKWNNYHIRISEYSPYIVKDSSDKTLIEVFNNHYNNIETFFSLYPASKFISYDIENDNIKKLEKYIDLKGINIFPHENKNLLLVPWNGI